MPEIALTIYILGFVITFAFLYYDENYGENAELHRMEFGHDSKIVEIMSITFMSALWPLILAVNAFIALEDTD